MQRKLKTNMAIFVGLIFLEYVMEFLHYCWSFYDRFLPGYNALGFVSPAHWLTSLRLLLDVLITLFMLRSLHAARHHPDATEKVATAAPSFVGFLASAICSAAIIQLMDYPALFQNQFSWFGALSYFGPNSLAVAIAISTVLLYYFVWPEPGVVRKVGGSGDQSVPAEPTLRASVIILPSVALLLGLNGTLMLFCYFDYTFNWFFLTPLYVLSGWLLWIAQRRYLAFSKARDEADKLRASQVQAPAEIQPEREGDEEIVIEDQEDPGTEPAPRRIFGYSVPIDRWLKGAPGLLFFASIFGLVLTRDNFDMSLFDQSFSVDTWPSQNLLQVASADWWWHSGAPNLAMFFLLLFFTWKTFNWWMFGKTAAERVIEV